MVPVLNVEPTLIETDPKVRADEGWHVEIGAPSLVGTGCSWRNQQPVSAAKGCLATERFIVAQKRLQSFKRV